MCIDYEVRKAIEGCKEKYILVEADAGTGKTTLMVKHAFIHMESILSRSYQRIGMLTFTRRAKREIENKIEESIKKGSTQWDSIEIKDIDSKKLEVFTNNSFINQEIIFPFLRDAKGKDYPREKELRMSFLRKHKFDTYAKGLEQIERTGYIGTFTSSKKNFAFTLAKEILEQSQFTREYLQLKYAAFYLDEYQDSDCEMHEFFMYLKNELEIPLFIIGDKKQLLYEFTGADPKIFYKLKSEGFKTFTLSHNFRSAEGIVKYANSFVRNTEYDFSTDGSVVLHEGDFDRFLKSIDSNTQMAFLVSSLKYMDDWLKYKLVQNYGFVEMKSPPIDTKFANYFILDQLLKHYHDSSSTVYRLLSELVLPLTKKNQKVIEQVMKNIENNEILKGLEEYAVLNESVLSDDEIEAFQQALNKQWRNHYSLVMPKRQILTIHSSKGLEFDYVFVDSKDFYRDGQFQPELHYVAITRPKKKLYIKKSSLYLQELRNK